MVGTLDSTAAGRRRPPSLQVPRRQQAARGADSPLSPPCWSPASPGGAGIARSYSINSVASPGSVTPEELSRILWAKHPGCRGWTPTTPPLRGAPRTFAQFQRTVNKPITSSERCAQICGYGWVKLFPPNFDTWHSSDLLYAVCLAGQNREQGYTPSTSRRIQPRCLLNGTRAMLMWEIYQGAEPAYKEVAEHMMAPM